MPALGNRGVVYPTKIKAAAKKPAPKIRSIPGKPEKVTFQQIPGHVGASHVAQQLHQVSSVKNLPKPPKVQKGSHPSLLSLATITNPGAILTQGYKNLASATGVKALEVPGKLAAEAVNLPTQAAVAAYHVGKASAKELFLHEGSELRKVGKEFNEESPVARLVQGDFAGAVKKAGEHPLGTALEVGGAASGLDRALLEGKHLGKSHGGRLRDNQATNVSREPKKFEEEAIPPGGATIAAHPYHKGQVRSQIEKAIGNKPIPPHATPRKIKGHVNRLEGESLRIENATREEARKQINSFTKASKTRRVPGHHAINQFNVGLLADPRILDREGKPLYRKQLAEAIEHYSKTPKEEQPEIRAMRDQLVQHLKELEGSVAFEANPHAAYKGALGTAKAKAAQEPELAEHGVYTPQTMRVAKLKKAFMFHFRDEGAHVEPVLKEAGESPFRLGGPEGRTVPVDEVVAKLKAKGVSEKQLAFVSTRPLARDSQAYVGGRRPGGAKVSKGVLTGHNFIRGHYDPTFEAVERQFVHDQKILNRARIDIRVTKDYVHTREHVAKLLEKHMGHLDEPQQTALRKYIQEDLRTGKHQHFRNIEESLVAAEKARSVNSDIRLTPMKVAHPYATAPYREAQGRHLDIDPMEDLLDPQHQGLTHEHWQSRMPGEGYAGPVGLVHPTVSKTIDAYEKQLGRAHFARMPSSFWRKFNVALSIRHVPGVIQEIGLRLGMNNTGVLSGMRGTRAADFIQEYAANHPNPEIKHSAQRIEALSRGSIAALTQEQRQFIPRHQVEGTGMQRPMELWDKGVARPITGAPLRAMRGAVKAFNKTTDAILKVERQGIEHPPQVAYYGKHVNEEFKRLHGQRLKTAGAMNDMEKEFLKGQLDPKAVDNAAAMLREYSGEWTRSSPFVKRAQIFSPFYQWYVNSLRFVYWTMPAHHPFKTGLLAAMETATREKRLAEGQEYKGGLPLGSKLLPTDLEPSQQGSIPIGKESRAGQQYYLPAGAVSAGPLETSVDALLPYASSMLLVAHGINPINDKPLTEVVNGKHVEISDINKLAMLASLAIAESFVPPIRYAQSLKTHSVAHTFRPFRTERTRTEVPQKKSKELGLKELGGGELGGKELGLKELGK